MAKALVPMESVKKKKAFGCLVYQTLKTLKPQTHIAA
jgi:hypothetical protein